MIPFELRVNKQPKQGVHTLNRRRADYERPNQKAELLPLVCHGVGVTVGVGVVPKLELPKPIVGQRFSCQVEAASYTRAKQRSALTFAHDIVSTTVHGTVLASSSDTLPFAAISLGPSISW